MDLVAWISVDCPQHITSIMENLKKIFYRAQPMEQCAILQTLSEMYANLVSRFYIYRQVTVNLRIDLY